MKSLHALLISTLAAQLCPTFTAAQHSYVEISTGLHTVDMEEGNTEIEMADVNHDGHPDLICVGDHGSPYVNATEHGIMTWLNDGAGNWNLVQVGNFGYGGIAAGDLNNDGFLDVAYGIHHNKGSNDFGDQLIEAALGDGTATNWIPWDDGLAQSGETWGMFGTDLADVDNDGDLDIGSASFGGSNGARIYLNNHDGTWTLASPPVGGGASILFTFGDVNADGNPDFAAGSGSTTIRLGDGTGNFSVGDANLPDASNRRGISLGDVNADGRDDLAYVTSSGKLAVYSLVAPGNWQSLSGNLPTSSNFDLTQIADMNLDGFGDLLASGAGNPGRTAIYTSDGAGNWSLLTTIFHPEYDDYAAFRAGTDLDHNGYPDLAVVGMEYVGGFPFSWRNRVRAYAENSTPTDPWIHPRAPRGLETWIAGSVRFIDWHAALPADAGNPTVTIELSTAGNAGPFSTIATNLPNSGRYQWNVPPSIPSSNQCAFRLTINTNPAVSTLTPTPFTISNPQQPIPADMNCDTFVNFDDIDGFVLALVSPDDYYDHYDCNWWHADCDFNGNVNFDDIDEFVTLLVGQ